MAPVSARIYHRADPGHRFASRLLVQQPAGVLRRRRAGSRTSLLLNGRRKVRKLFRIARFFAAVRSPPRKEARHNGSREISLAITDEPAGLSLVASARRCTTSPLDLERAWL
jgi:hypothetical protein